MSESGGGPLRVLRRVGRRRGGGKKIAVVVDGPNMLRRDVGVDLEEISERLQRFGSCRIKVVVLDKKAPEKLVEAVVNAGYKTVISPGKVEVDFSIAAMEAIGDKKIDAIALVTRSAAYVSLVYKAKEAGKEVIVVGAEPGFSVALKKAADSYLVLPTESAQAVRK